MIQRFVIGKPFPTESVVLDLPITSLNIREKVTLDICIEGSLFAITISILIL